LRRIVLAWEIGLNLGHLARLQPLAQTLRRIGHQALVAARDLGSAAKMLGPAGIPFVQAPHFPERIQLPHRAASFADILRSQGWDDLDVLGGMLCAWMTLY
jgi:UDP:flavonoid glycosyltransferase YjiC (YdhE family)